MTAVNVFLRRDRGFVMTDAAMYAADGSVVGFGQKAVAMPGLNAVVVCRGAQKATALIAMELSMLYRTFDDMMDQCATYLRSWHDANLQALADVGFQDINVLVAGWSEKSDRPMGFYFDSSTDTFDRLGDAGDSSWYISGPQTSDEEDENLHSIRCELDIDVTARNFDPIRHGIPYMEAQRRMKIDNYSDVADGAISIVGGNILLSEITRGGVSQRIIHRWNDEIGRPIEPEPFRATADGGGAAISRQQRRAMERAQRKVRA